MDRQSNLRFRNPSFAFGDLLDTYIQFNGLLKSELLADLNVELDKKKKKKIKTQNRITEWIKGQKVPDVETVRALSHVLHDGGKSLENARAIAEQVTAKVNKLRKHKLPVEGIKDPPDWRFSLCKNQLYDRIQDPVWSELFTTLLLTLPERVRTLLSVRQSSFGRYAVPKHKPVHGKVHNASGISMQPVGSSTERESVQYLAIDLILQPGAVIFHQDKFPGFEFSVGIGGRGVFLVGDEIGASEIIAYPIQVGSCVGYGAKLPHAVVSTDPDEDLILSHFCFPYRKIRKGSASVARFELVGKSSIDRHVPMPMLATALSLIREALEAKKQFDSSPAGFTKLFAAHPNITTPTV